MLSALDDLPDLQNRYSYSRGKDRPLHPLEYASKTTETPGPVHGFGPRRSNASRECIAALLMLLREPRVIPKNQV